MLARSPGAIVGDFANPIECPFFLLLRPTTHWDVPFRLPAFSFLSSNIPFLFNRYYAVLVLDRENWEIQSNNPWDFSTGCFRASATLNEPSLSSLSYFSRYSFYSFPHGRQQTTTKRCQQGFCRSRVVRKKENDGKLSSWWSLYGRYANNRKYPCCHIIDAI